MFGNILKFFVEHDRESGHTDLTSHKIDTEIGKLIKFPPGRLPIHQRDIDGSEIGSMLQKEVVRPCKYLWDSPIVLV